MKLPDSGTRRSFISFFAILGSFLIIADGLIISQLYQRNLSELETSALNEAELFASLVSQDLARGDYSSVEQAALNWGASSTRIIDISVITSNGFELARYQDADQGEYRLPFRKMIRYGDGQSATIMLEVDTSDIRSYLLKLTGQLLVFSVVLVILLGYFLQRVAIIPLRKEIEEHLKTEKNLEQHARELDVSNNELESYSYTMAHDLRAPLRAIISFSKILEDDCAEKLCKDDLENLARIHRAGLHMGELVDDLIQLSRIARTPLKPADCNISDLATELVKRHQAVDPQREISIHIQSGMHARGDVKLIERLLENLIDNAWKYTGKTDNPEIEIGMDRVEGEKCFFVRDNGAGFDMQYAEKLFEPFQRLHKTSDFEGTGIGLASVKRIIQMHGGDIRITAVPGEGCTVHFSLTPGY